MNAISIHDFINNDNFDMEALFVIRFVDKDYETTREFHSWEDDWRGKNLRDALPKTITYMTVIPGCGTMVDEPVLVLEVRES